MCSVHNVVIGTLDPVLWNLVCISLYFSTIMEVRQLVLIYEEVVQSSSVVINCVTNAGHKLASRAYNCLQFILGNHNSMLLCGALPLSLMRVTNHCEQTLSSNINTALDISRIATSERLPVTPLPPL